MTEDQAKSKYGQNQPQGRDDNPGDHQSSTSQAKGTGSMNQDQMKGKMTQMKAKFKETWDRLTDDEIGLYNDQREKFYGKLQEKYGLAKEEAEEKIKDMEKNASSGTQAGSEAYSQTSRSA